MERESFASRLGFILVSAGCAIGIGNVWKFPYLAGQYGGGIFVLFYLLFLIIMGIPVLTMELAIGRASGKSSVGGYKALEPKGSRWHIHGFFCLGGCALLMMYYTTVSGWMLDYFYKFATGQFEAFTVETSNDVFINMLGNPKEMTIFMAITVLFGFLVCAGGIRKGVEKVTKIMMICLLALILVLAVHSLTLKGAGEGLRFYLLPSLEKVKAAGLRKVITAAMNQAFFTLSLGIGSMEIFGSYMSKEHTLTGEAVRICALDTFVALMSGLIIFPAVFSFPGVEPGEGPALIFMTLPKIFLDMAGGRLWGTLFFLFMTFASFSTVTAVFENIVAIVMDDLGWSRKKTVIIECIFFLIASMPVVLGYNVWSHIHPIGGRDILDSEDFIVSNLLLPIGALVYVLFCVSRKGWGFQNYLKEVNTGDGPMMSRRLHSAFQFLLPALILILLIQGLI